MNKKKNEDINPSTGSGQENLREELINEAEKEELVLEADEEIEQIEKEEAKDPTHGSGQGNSEGGKIEELENQLKRALADYQNLERRVSDQKANWIISANKDLILRLLPGLDNLLLADKHTQDEGVKIAIKHFVDILESDGVKKIKTENADFDPNLMEAVTTAQGEEGKVVEEIKAGYTLNGEVIRPAQVIVGKASN